MNSIKQIIDVLNAIVWGPPLLILLIAIGLYLTIRTQGLQFRHFFYAHKLAFNTRSDDQAKGDISHFQALMTSLASTIGIGSITGIATGIAFGGIGSLFWMWCAALVGMATKYGEGILSIKYRVLSPSGQMCGGPMYYIEKGLGSKSLGVIFAILGAITACGTGNMIQSNSLSIALSSSFNINPYWSGMVLLVGVGIALIGGIKSIGKVVAILVPIMALFYIVGGLIMIALRIDAVPATFGLIFRSAFNGQAACGGFAGATVMMAMQFGISRGIFSSEAGLGSSPIVAASAKTDIPGRQALISMCSVFLTTGIVCTITGLVIGISGVLGELDANGRPLDGGVMVLKAFDTIIPYGGLIVTIAMIPFAYSTILGWAYCGEKCTEYLFGNRVIIAYRLIYTLFVLIGSLLDLKLVWGFANMMNGLMAFPNLLALFFLSGTIATETQLLKHHIKKEKLEKVG